MTYHTVVAFLQLWLLRIATFHFTVVALSRNCDLISINCNFLIVSTLYFAVATFSELQPYNSQFDISYNYYFLAFTTSQNRDLLLHNCGFLSQLWLHLYNCDSVYFISHNCDSELGLYKSQFDISHSYDFLAIATSQNCTFFFHSCGLISQLWLSHHF